MIHIYYILRHGGNQWISDCEPERTCIYEIRHQARHFGALTNPQEVAKTVSYGVPYRTIKPFCEPAEGFSVSRIKGYSFLSPRLSDGEQSA
jgi:hypothetical protein